MLTRTYRDAAYFDRAIDTLRAFVDALTGRRSQPARPSKSTPAATSKIPKKKQTQKERKR
jgi:hypothetical protein